MSKSSNDKNWKLWITTSAVVVLVLLIAVPVLIVNYKKVQEERQMRMIMEELAIKVRQWEASPDGQSLRERSRLANELERLGDETAGFLERGDTEGAKRAIAERDRIRAQMDRIDAEDSGRKAREKRELK